MAGGSLAFEVGNTVHWNGTGDWTNQNNWVDSAAAPDWGIPGWVEGNPLYTGNSTDLDWNGGAANIDSGTVNITPDAKPDGTVDVLHVSCDASSATLNISTDFTVRSETYTGYFSTADDISTINQTAGNVLLVNKVNFSYDPLGTTRYNLSGGTLETRGADVLFGRLGTFEFNQTGGTYTHIGANEVYISVYGGADATINLEDGTFRANVDGVGLGRTSAAVFNQTGGTFEAAKLEMALLAASEGTYSISGGSFTVSGSVYGNAGTAVFEVLGSDSTIIEAGSFDLSEDTFRVKLDDNGSTLVEAVDGGINLTDATLEVDVLAGFSGTPGDTYDIMWTANGFLTNGMVISNLGSAEFDWDVVTKDGGEVLRLIRRVTPSEDWAIGHGLTGADAEAGADSDGDGLSNLYEYGLGGDPTNSADTGISPTYGLVENAGTNWMAYVYPKQSDANSGLIYYLELTADLVDGPWVNSGYSVVGTGTINSEFDAVTNWISTDVEDQKFIHLIIEEN